MTHNALCRQSHSSIAIDDSLWIFGGENEASKLTNTLSQYLIESKEWKNFDITQFEIYPSERAGHSMIEYNHNLYIFGGDGGPKKGRFNDLWKFDLNKCHQKDAFKNLNTFGQIPCKRMKHQATIYDKYMFIFGGCDDQNYQNNNNDNNNNQDPFQCLYVIDLSVEPLIWHKIYIKNLATRIRHSFHVLNVVDKKDYFQITLFIAMGEDKNAFLQNDIFILQCSGKIKNEIVNKNDEEKKENDNDGDNKNIMEILKDSNNWKCSKIQDVPFKLSPRFGHTLIVLPFDIINDKQKIEENIITRNVVIFGGYSGEMSVLNDFWLLTININLENDTFKLKQCKCLGLKNLPSPRHGHSLNIFNNKGLVIYGGINLQFQTFSDIKMIEINLKEWNEMKENQQQQLQYGGFGMTEQEKQSAKMQFKNMGFTDEQIDNALSKAQNFDQALAILLG